MKEFIPTVELDAEHVSMIRLVRALASEGLSLQFNPRTWKLRIVDYATCAGGCGGYG